METRQTSVFQEKQILCLSTTGTLQYNRKEEGRPRGACRRGLVQSHGQGVYKVLDSLCSLSFARVKFCTNSFEVMFVTEYTLNHK